jgi:hypothetical protein
MVRTRLPIAFTASRSTSSLIFRLVPDFVLQVHRAYFFDLRGTFLPFLRASESPIAIACLRLFTFPPRPPLPRFKVPRLRLCIARLTSFDAPRE